MTGDQHAHDGRRSRWFVVISVGSVVALSVAGSIAIARYGPAKSTSHPTTPPGPRIAFARTRQPAASSVERARSAIFTVTPSGGDVARVTPWGLDVDWPSWSAGGSLVFQAAPGGDPRERHLFVLRSVDATPAQLTEGDWDDLTPAWSPDGTRIAFVSDRADPHRHRTGHAPVFDLYVMRSDGAAARRLTFCTPALCAHDGRNNGRFAPTWSPDGAFIAFASDGDLYVIDAFGGDPVRLTDTPGLEADPAWSPNGARLLFTYAGDGSSVFVMNADGSGRARVGEGFAPAWSPDGTRFVYASFREGTPSGEGQVGDSALYVSALSGEPTRITDGPDLDGRPAWTGPPA